MKCQTAGSMNQPAIAPEVAKSTAFSTRLRSSLMCSISGIRASGLTTRRLRGMRILREPFAAPFIVAEPSSWADITVPWAQYERVSGRPAVAEPLPCCASPAAD